MTTFELWWTAEVGHPPSNNCERYAFDLAKKAWETARKTHDRRN